MAPSTSKRLKSLKLSRHFLIGNTAVQLPHPSFPNPPEGHSKGWKVYVRPLPNGPDISTWLKKVQFKLHHTYADASRTIEAPGPFEISETGYGEFGVEIRLYFPPESGEKAQYREHYLVLGQYGSEEQQERQKRENFIVAERVETIEFNEPTADFFKNLTSEEQYAWLKTKKGRGKGKKPEMVFQGDVPPSAQLPEKAVGGPVGDAIKGMEAGKGGVWSAQYERQLVSQLEASEKQLARMIDEEKSAVEARKARMAELGRKIDAKG
jgi:YEATS domain-containing protein 4